MAINSYSVIGILNKLHYFSEIKEELKIIHDDDCYLCFDFFKYIFTKSEFLSVNQFYRMMHDGNTDYLKKIFKREKGRRNATKRFGETLGTAIGQTYEIQKLDTCFLSEIPQKIIELIKKRYKNGISNKSIRSIPREIDFLTERIDNLIQDFLNLDDEAITDNHEFNKKAKEIIQVLNRNHEKELCLWWILLISIYPQEHQGKDYTLDLLAYWKQSPQLAKLLHGKLMSLTLTGVSEALESLVDEDMDITIARFNQAIEERTSLFEISGISCRIIGENESFLSAVSQVNTFLCTYPQYQSYIRLILTMPKKRIKSTVLKKLNANAKEDINMLRTKKILFRENEYYYLDYSYQTVIEYMRSVSNDFFTKYSELRSFCYEYYVGKWEEVLILLLIDQRELLSRDEKQFLLSCIKFDKSSELIKQVYENAII